MDTKRAAGDNVDAPKDCGEIWNRQIPCRALDRMVRLILSHLLNRLSATKDKFGEISPANPVDSAMI